MKGGLLQSLTVLRGMIATNSSKINHMFVPVVLPSEVYFNPVYLAFPKPEMEAGTNDPYGAAKNLNPRSFAYILSCRNTPAKKLYENKPPRYPRSRCK